MDTLSIASLKSEAMRIVISQNADKVAQYVSQLIVDRINDFGPSESRPFVLGLPTGGTPVKTYQLLIKAFREGRVSFKNVVTFNMDEYVGIPEDHPQSYHSFMRTNFFNFIDIPKQNINILNGNAQDLLAECTQFEEKIKSYGGIELFLGGLGSDGHIAFNEPGSSLTSLTRVKSLNDETIEANARFFNGDISQVPTMSLTVGIETIMRSRTVVIIATGAKKSTAVREMVEGHISHTYPCTALQSHRSCVLCLDEEATMDLRVKTVKYFKGLLVREHELHLRQENAKRLKAKL